MPLHLLGKKSWNVYNSANIERVQRDEDEARKREEEDERQRRHDEAEHRIATLKGERHQEEEDHRVKSSASYGHEDDSDGVKRRMAKKRKLPGEDDTDRDIRLAQAQAQNSIKASADPSSKTRPNVDSFTDKNGHISLIPTEARSEDTYKKQKRDDNPAHFYLSEAAAYGSKAGDTPWYSSTKDHTTHAEEGSWGSKAPRRKEREAARMSANDPLAAMKRGVWQLRESERERDEWRAQRERDLKEVEKMAMEKSGRDRERHRHRHRERREDGTVDRRERGRGHEKRRRSAKDDNDSELDSLDQFNLDEGYREPHRYRDHDSKDKSASRGHHHRHRRRRSHSPRERKPQKSSDKATKRST